MVYGVFFFLHQIYRNMLLVNIRVFFRFLYNHIRDLRDHVLKLPKKKQMKEWQKIQEGVSNQVLLRIVSCCQIASKLTSHYKVRFLTEIYQVYEMKYVW